MKNFVLSYQGFFLFLFHYVFRLGIKCINPICDELTEATFLFYEG